VTGTLQLVLENFVKHNEASFLQPLMIGVYICDEMLSIENEVRLKDAISEGVGLQNLEHRYRILSGKNIIYKHIGDKFIVKIPLIKHLKAQ